MEPQEQPIEPQQKTKRIRRRSFAIQLQTALDDAASASSADISVQKLIQCRIDALLTLQARERNIKLKQALAEIARLTTENERLKPDLAAKPEVPRPQALSEAGQVLAKYSAEREAEKAQDPTVEAMLARAAVNRVSVPAPAPPKPVKVAKPEQPLIFPWRNEYTTKPATPEPAPLRQRPEPREMTADEKAIAAAKASVREGRAL